MIRQKLSAIALGMALAATPALTYAQAKQDKETREDRRDVRDDRRDVRDERKDVVKDKKAGDPVSTEDKKDLAKAKKTKRTDRRDKREGRN